MELQTKMWITHKGGIVLGRGRADLLEAIDATGSISAAARRVGMSYRHAWTLLQATEKRVGQAMLHRSKGGAGGGGARLTDRARALLGKYRSLEADLMEFVRRKERDLSRAMAKIEP